MSLNCIYLVRNVAVVGCCERCNEYSGLLKGDIFLELPSYFSKRTLRLRSYYIIVKIDVQYSLIPKQYGLNAVNSLSINSYYKVVQI